MDTRVRACFFVFLFLSSLLVRCSFVARCRPTSSALLPPLHFADSHVSILLLRLYYIKKYSSHWPSPFVPPPASLFPGHALLDEKNLLVASIENSPKLPPQRITLTYPVINSARHVVFVAAGGSKAEAMPRVVPDGATMHKDGLAKTLASSQVGEDLLPSARVRPTSGSLHYYVDEGAASNLVVASPASDL